MSNNNIFSSKPKKSASNASHSNFIEALKSSSAGIARDVSQSFVNDFAVGTGKQFVDTLIGNHPQENQSPHSPQESQQPPFDFAEYLKSSEANTRAQDRVKYEFQQSETVIFNRRQKEVEQKIESIRIELKKIAKEVVHLDTATQTAITQEVVDPGTYHLSFFEKLLQFLVTLRKRVVESRHWASLQSQRSKAKSYYWHMAGKKVGGTKFSLSHERAVATQTG